MGKLNKLFDRRKARNRTQLKKHNRQARMRLSVFSSNQYIYVQLINDKLGVTLASASSFEKELQSKLKSCSNIEAAREVGLLIGERAKKLNIDQVVFDKGGKLYHGKLKALADAARENGLLF
jgi:large subunit ribosomal protein L18